MSKSRDSLVETLDFNGTNFPDVLAATLFRHAAIEIRFLERECDHYKHAASVERRGADALRQQVRELERDLASAIEARRAATGNTDAVEDESAIAATSGETPNLSSRLSGEDE